MRMNLPVVLLASLMTSAGIAGCSDSSSSAGTGGGVGTTATGGTTGGGGGGRSGTGGSTGVGGAASATGGAGGSACDATYKCQQAVTPPSNDPTKLCAGSVAATKFATVQACLCTGPCAAKCSTTLCLQQMPSTDCFTCLVDTSAAGCGKESADCAAN